MRCAVFFHHIEFGWLHIFCFGFVKLGHGPYICTIDVASFRFFFTSTELRYFDLERLHLMKGMFAFCWQRKICVRACFLGRARLRVESALWSHVCVVVVVVEDPPILAGRPPPYVMDGWGARPLRWLSVLVSNGVAWTRAACNNDTEFTPEQHTSLLYSADCVSERTRRGKMCFAEWLDHGR